MQLLPHVALGAGDPSKWRWTGFWANSCCKWIGHRNPRTRQGTIEHNARTGGVPEMSPSFDAYLNNDIAILHVQAFLQCGGRTSEWIELARTLFFFLSLSLSHSLDVSLSPFLAPSKNACTCA